VATGFKVADAYINVHTEDDTKRGRDKIEKDTSVWAHALGGRIGSILGVGLAGSIAGTMMKVFSGLLTVSKWLVIAAAVGAVTQAVAGLGVALAQLAGLAPLAVPAILSLISVFGALKIAVSGFGAALKAAWEGGDATKIDELLKKLAPSAQAAVKQIIALKPALTAFKLAVQEAAFKGLAADIQVLAGVYLPMLQTHLSGVATIFNQMVHDLVRFFTAKDVVADWVATFAGIRGVLGNLAAGLVGVLDGFRHIGTVATPILQQLTSGFGDWAKHFAELMKSFRDSGAMAAFIDKGITAFGQLFDLLKNIWMIISPLFHIIADSGGDVLQLMIDLTGQFARFLTSAEATKAITGILQALNQVLVAIGPGVLAVLGGLGQSLVILAPAITALGMAIGEGLVALAPALTVAASALVTIITALTPILPIVAQFIADLITVAAPVLVALAPIVTQLFKDLSAVLTPLLPTIGQLALALVPLVDLLVTFAAGNVMLLLQAAVQIIGALVPILMEVLPPFTALVQNVLKEMLPIVVSLVKALAPLVIQLGGALVSALAKILPPLIPIISMLIEKLLPVIVALTPVIVQLVSSFADLLAAVLVQLGPIIEQFIGPLIEMAISVLPSLIPLIAELTQTFISLLPFIGPVVLLFLKLAIILLPVLIQLLPFIIGLITGVLGVVNDILGPLAAFLGYLVGLTDKFIDLQWLFEQAKKSFEAFKDGIKLGWDSVWKVFQQFIDYIKSIVDKSSSLPALIKNLFVGAVDWLFSSGKDIVLGLWNGIKSMGSWIKDKVGGFFHDAVPSAVRKVLGIDSPSKVMAALGQWVPKGLAVGMDGALGTVTDAATRLAAAAMPALQSPGFPVAPGGVPGTFATSGQGAPTGGGDTYILADFGDGVRQLVKGVLATSPDLVAAGTDEGRRQRNFLNPARGVA
jgi:phage-related protein